MTRETSRVKYIAYCFTCNTKFGEVTRDHYSDRFFCPKDSQDNPPHTTSVVIGSTSGLRWAKIQSLILQYETRWSPRHWFSSWGGLFKERVGLYLIVRSLFVVLALALQIPFMQSLKIQPLFFFISFAIAVVIIVDALIVTTSAAFVSRHYSVPLRSALYSLCSFAQLVLAFAVFYLTFGNSFNKCLNPISAVYFSFVTITTLGYGDFRPLENAWHVQVLVVAQLIVGLYFLVVLVAIIANWANALPTGPPKVKLQDILQPDCKSGDCP